MFECIDFKLYFESNDKWAYIIKVENELAGFVLLDKVPLIEPVDWNMGEFFILAKFQGKKIAQYVAKQIFKTHPGKWSVAVMPENIRAVKFWRQVVVETYVGKYSEVFKTSAELKTPENPDPYSMIIFTFKT